MAASFAKQASSPSHELGATDPPLSSQAELGALLGPLQEFGEIAPELEWQAKSPLHEPGDTGPVFWLQASCGWQLGGFPALPIPADPSMSKIPQTAISDIRLFMPVPPKPSLSLPQICVKENFWLRRSMLPLTC